MYGMQRGGRRRASLCFRSEVVFCEPSGTKDLSPFQRTAGLYYEVGRVKSEAKPLW